MKSGRLLTMLLLLQARGRICARELAAYMEVSQRTIYRDLDALSAAGVPVHAERGVQGGIVLAEGYRKALTQFSEDEIRALFIAGENPLADIGLADRPRALEKLAGALPDAQRKAIDTMRARVYLDQRRWKQSAQPREHLALLRVAIWEDRRVLLHYKDRNHKTSQRVIDPLGLVAKAGVWYLVARSQTELRTFRAERIIRVEETVETFIRPEGFDLVAFWRDWTTKYEDSVPSYPVILRVARDALDDVSAYWESHLLDDSGNQTQAIVRVVFPALEVAVHQVVAWGRKVEAIEPQELRRQVLVCARDVIAQYAGAAR